MGHLFSNQIAKADAYPLVDMICNSTQLPVGTRWFSLGQLGSVLCATVCGHDRPAVSSIGLLSTRTQCDNSKMNQWPAFAFVFFVNNPVYDSL